MKRGRAETKRKEKRKGKTDKREEIKAVNGFAASKRDNPLGVVMNQPGCENGWTNGYGDRYGRSL